MTEGRRSGPIVLGMAWHDLLFAHWPVPVEAMRPLVPAGLRLDTYDGMAWVGIVPFRMIRLRPLRLPLPGNRFAAAEINVRTYATVAGRRGAWFLSLDIDHRLAAIGGRVGFGLPYVQADVRATREGEGVRFESARRTPGAEFRARYRPIGPVFRATPGSLDAFLTDRLSLFAAGPAWRLRVADVEHPPWPLQPAEADIELNTMAAAHGIDLPDVPPHLLFARRLDVVARAPRGITG